MDTIYRGDLAARGEDYDEAALRRDFAAGGLASFVNHRLLARE